MVSSAQWWCRAIGADTSLLLVEAAHLVRGPRVKA